LPDRPKTILIAARHNANTPCDTFPPVKASNVLALEKNTGADNDTDDHGNCCEKAIFSLFHVFLIILSIEKK
jgi:hypothetical protein